MEVKKIYRCVVYTRKSNENGLEQEFNSLTAQRESAENYIASQKANGWQLLPEKYDDGGFSGGNMNRPALKRLLADVEAGKLDIIVVYKMDRLSRSLLDFMKLAEMLEQHNVSFVSVTQDINTSTSAGRMMLNILMTFGQYEMEIIADRIRTSVASAKRRGKHCGGYPSLGYDADPDTKKLHVNEEEAELVRFVFKRYCELASLKKVAHELNEKGFRTKTWKTRKGEIHKSDIFKPDTIYRILKNPLYIGKVPHKGNIYQGEHEAIIDMELWERAKMVTGATGNDGGGEKNDIDSPFRGLLKCGHCGGTLSITYTRKKDRRYTYYYCVKDNNRAASECPVIRIPAGDTDKIILRQLEAVFRTPSLLAQVYFEAEKIASEEKTFMLARKEELQKTLEGLRREMFQGAEDKAHDSEIAQEKLQKTARELSEIESGFKFFEKGKITNKDIIASFNSIDALWEELFPAERYRLAHLLIEKITIFRETMRIELKTCGMSDLAGEISGTGMEMKDGEISANQASGKPSTVKPELSPEGNIILNVPIRMKYKNGRKVIIAPEAVDGEVPDAESPVKAPLAQAIARAHAWLRLIETGKVANMAQLAEKLELDHAYVSRIFRLVNIAPDITEAIVNGTENAVALSLQNLRAPVPVDWKKQRQLLGVEK